MPRDPRLISLYHKRLCCHARYGRDTRQRLSASILACCAIGIGTLSFFWAYGAVASRIPFIPPVIQPTGAGHTASLRYATPKTAPAPDMKSPEVAFANSDVPAAFLVQAERFTTPVAVAIQVPVVPKKKVAKVTKRVPRAAANAYAAEPNFFRMPFGGY